jgi:hypothetical protein
MITIPVGAQQPSGSNLTNTFQTSTVLSHSAAPLLWAAHAAVRQYLNPVSRGGAPQITDMYLFSRVQEGQFNSFHLVEFLKREKLFWQPLSKISNRSHLGEVITVLREELHPLPVPLAKAPAAWMRLIERMRRLSWTSGATFRITSLRLLWLFSPATIVKWDEEQCIGLSSRGENVKYPITDEGMAISFIESLKRDRAARSRDLNWARAMSAALNENRPYPYQAFIHDRVLAFEGADDWRRHKMINSILRGEPSRKWLIQVMRHYDNNQQ